MVNMNVDKTYMSRERWLTEHLLYRMPRDCIDFGDNPLRESNGEADPHFWRNDIPASYYQPLVAALLFFRASITLPCSREL